MLLLITIAMTYFSYFININKFQLSRINSDMDGRLKCPLGIKNICIFLWCRCFELFKTALAIPVLCIELGDGHDTHQQ